MIGLALCQAYTFSMEPCAWSLLPSQKYIFCEAQLCGWISQPANTFSNLAYLAVVWCIYRSSIPIEKHVKLFFGISIFALFLFSSFFHATGSHIGKMLDVASMFLISMGLLTLTLQRLLTLSNKRALIFFSIGLFLSLLFLYIRGHGDVFFLAQILAAVVAEYILIKQGREHLSTRRLSQSIIALAFGGIVWWMDVVRILCWPNQHFISGHGLWHALTALALWFLYRAYSDRPRLS